MGDEPNQINPNEPKEKSSGPTPFGWFLIGLIPIPIWLLFVTGSGDPPSRMAAMTILVITIVCNLVGGIGCMENFSPYIIALVILGIFIAAFLFALTMVVAVFVGCVAHPPRF
jgi:hypothetical protein